MDVPQSGFQNPNRSKCWSNIIRSCSNAMRWPKGRAVQVNIVVGLGLTIACAYVGGEALASMVMDHGRTGPQGALNGSEGGANTVRFDFKDGSTHTPLHLSKEQDITVRPGDVIDVCTPCGGGYGNPSNRDQQKVQDDIRKGYYSAEQSATLFPIKGSE